MGLRVMYCAPLLFALPLAAPAADAPSEVTVIKLSVQAKAAPKPALKYSLLPELKDMEQGNPVPAYYKCFMEQNNFFYSKEANEDRQKWLTCPLADLPKTAENYSGGIGKQADYAARLDACDWQILNFMKTNGGQVLLPDVQQLRLLATVLKVRYRGQIKAGRFDDAIETHQTLFALARHLGEHPSLIGNLVGMSIANVAVGPFEEMIQQSGCPNLYWALAQLPSPLAGIGKGLQGERIFVFGNLREYSDASRVWSEHDLFKVRDSVRQDYQNLGLTREYLAKLQKWLTDRLKDEKWLAEARQKLIADGLPEAAVKNYPPEQVAFQKMWTKYEAARDDLTKWFALPYWQAEPEFVKIQGPSEQQPFWLPNLKTTDEDAIAKSFVCGTIPKKASARLDQRIAMLQIVEALRLHAADNNGKLPADLLDVKVPLPVDPITGKAFAYKLDGSTGILRNTPPKRKEHDATHNIRYELSIRK